MFSSILFGWGLLSAFTANLVAGDIVPPPLGETPLPLETSSPLVEVVKSYSLPNPEEVAVYVKGKFFVSGTNDGYVSKVDLATGKAETIFTPRDFRPGFFANVTDQEIRNVCDGSDLAREKNCGRVLGVKFELDPITKDCKSIWMANAYFGIFEGSCEAPWTLQRRISIKGGFVNDIQPHGRYLYYTITHDTKQRNQLPYVVLDDTAPAGSLHRLDIGGSDLERLASYQSEVLARDLYFANGLAVSTNGLYIYVSETTAARIEKYNVRTGALEPYLDNIPVLTDNIAVQDGELLVPGYTRNATMEMLLTNPDLLNTFLERGPSYITNAFKAMVAPHGNLLVYEEATGKLKDRFFQDFGGNFTLASSAHKMVNATTGEHEGFLVGSVFTPKATWFRVIPDLSTSKPTEAPTMSTSPTRSPTELTDYPTISPTGPVSPQPTLETSAPTDEKSYPTYSPTEDSTLGAPKPPESNPLSSACSKRHRRGWFTKVSLGVAACLALVEASTGRPRILKGRKEG